MLQQLARAAVKPVAAGYDIVRRPVRGVTILIYHRVGGGTASQVDLDPGLFAEQMAALADTGRVLTLDDALAAVAAADAGDTPRGNDPVVITFDDGTPDVAEIALPILERHRLPALLYLATDFIESGRPFWDPTDRALSWSAIGDANQSGLLSIGSHTHTHALLDRLDPPAIAAELDRSIVLIGERLGVEARHFAYPKALPPSAAADTQVRARFASAALAGTRPNPYGATDPHLLARSPIQRSDGMRWFTHKARGGLGLEDRIRDRLNRRRYADAVT